MWSLSAIRVSNIFRSSGDGSSQNWIGACLSAKGHMGGSGEEGRAKLPLDFVLNLTFVES
jgi:hypothetical protein